MTPFHVPAGTEDAVTALVGNPLYDMASEHGLAVAAVALLTVAAYLARSIGGRRLARLVACY